MTKQELLNQLINRGFQAYNLERGFDEFETKYISTIDQPRFEPFIWRTENGDEVTVEVKIGYTYDALNDITTYDCMLL